MIEPTDEYQESGFYEDPELTADVAQQARTTALSALDQGRDYIRANPAATVLGALAVGLVLGMISARCGCEDEKEKANDRLDELKDVISSLSDKVSSTAGHQYSVASSALASAVKMAKKRLKLS